MKKNKHILWHYPHLKFWNGGSRFLIDVGQELIKKGYRLTIITNTGNAELTHKAEQAGIQVKYTSAFSTNDIWYWLCFPLFLIFDIYQTWVIVNRSPQATLLATLFPSNVIMCVVGWLVKTKYHFYCYEPFPFFHNRTFIHTFTQPKRTFLKVLAILYGWLDVWATQRAQVVWTLNEITQKMTRQTYHVPSVITLMGVDAHHFQPQKKLWQDQYRDRLLVTHATDYSEMKRTDLALTALAKVVKKVPQVLLVITSTQPDSPRQKIYLQLAQKLKLDHQVLFLGLLDFNELPRLYSQAIVYLSCSYDEMLGTTSSNLPVKESLAAGTPAIRAPITLEDVEDGISGYLLDPRQTTKVSAALIRLLKNPTLAKKMGLAGRQKIKKLYTWPSVAATMIQSLGNS